MSSDRQTVRAVVNHVAAARGLPAPWPEVTACLPDWLAGEDLRCWGVTELGELRQQILSTRDCEKYGTVYTPDEVTGWQIQATLDGQLERLVDVDRPLEHLTIHDPFCGPGNYLIAAARHIAAWCLDRRSLEHTRERVRWVTGEVLTRCIYGTDIDAVAIDIARAVCWLEIAGTRPVTFMDANIAVGDTFNNELPPALALRWPAAAAAAAPPVTPLPPTAVGQSDLFELGEAS